MTVWYRIRPPTFGLKRWVNVLLLLLVLWLGAGVWIWSGLGRLFRPSLPGAFRFLDPTVSGLTIFAVILGLILFALVACSKAVRRICVPLLGLIDMFALCGCLAMVLE